MPRPLPPVQDVPAPAVPITVVGDVHLTAAEPEVTERFLAWLGTQVGGGGTLVLLGDLFEMWVGAPQQHDPLPRRVLAALATVAEAGTRLVFVPGNRDPGFRGADGVSMELWRDPVRTTLDGRTVLFTHGDQLCTADHGYLALRNFYYGPGGQAIERFVPYGMKRRIAQSIRNSSKRAAGTKTMRSMDIDYGEALRWMEGFAAEVLVAGHVHTGVHHRHAGPSEREILVLKDWERGGGIITYDGRAWELRAP